MVKKFNITGTCRPAKHYMADVSKKLAETLAFVGAGEYFIINRPRQYGKTTTLYTIADILRRTGEYLVFNMSFEAISETSFESESAFAPSFIRFLAKSIRSFDAVMAAELLALAPTVEDFEGLSVFINQLSENSDKKIVLMIDEVDKSSNNQLFLSFLGVLRNMYLEQDSAKTFHSVVLAGLHDIKTLKLKLRPDAEAKYNSPWDIATDFKVDMNLYPDEIKPMLDDYAAEQGVTMDTKWVAERLFYYTSGYPFLVSKLCKTIAEELVPKKEEKTWTFEDIEQSVRLLMKEINKERELNKSIFYAAIL